MSNKLNAVLMMRKIRDQLSEEYLKSPQKEKDDLRDIRKKLNIQTSQKELNSINSH